MRETIRGGKVIALAASTKKTTKKTITIASKTATIPAGSTKTITLTLNGAGKRLLAKHHPLKAKLTVTQSRKTVTEQDHHPQNQHQEEEALTATHSPQPRQPPRLAADITHRSLTPCRQLLPMKRSGPNSILVRLGRPDLVGLAVDGG